MFVQERQEKILTLLRQDGKVLVKELSGRFSVTEDCIRKDLASLEKQGLLKRAYGGAVAPRVNTHEAWWPSAAAWMWRQSGPSPKRR